MITNTASIQFHDLHPVLNDIRNDILEGLKARPKKIAPKYFYDEQGSKLFDRICQLPEYYLTRTEIGLLKKYGPQIARQIGSNTILFEFGSGSSIKIRLLLDAIRPSSYVPLDISREHLLHSVHLLAKDYPWLDIHAVCVDYARTWDLPVSLEDRRRIVFFPGSSIGNLDTEEAIGLLQQIARLVGDDGGLLIGVDLIKDTRTLEVAYNDPQGITAEFNKNLLLRINRELQANFQKECFKHKAFYNKALNRIEMHLESDRDQIVRVADESFTFHKGETIHTENSHKYTISGFQQMAFRAGFRSAKVWTDTDHLFSIHYLQT